MNVSVRRARVTDAEAICRFGAQDDAFVVSDRIPFYERVELKQWAAAPADNILLVVEEDESLLGFCFCKIMSHHWAMLDNFYILPAYRGFALGLLLLNALRGELRSKGIQYLSTLALTEDAWLRDYLARNGFDRKKMYEWHEMFL